MSDTDNTTETKKPRGQTHRTEAELREAFEAATVNADENLFLQVDGKDSKLRCTVSRIDGKKIETIYGPKAGNSFIRALEAAVQLGPHLGL